MYSNLRRLNQTLISSLEVALKQETNAICLKVRIILNVASLGLALIPSLAAEQATCFFIAFGAQRNSQCTHLSSQIIILPPFLEDFLRIDCS